MSLLSFAARCPHCNHEFTVRVDAEKIKNKNGRVTCSNCKRSCQIEGEGAYYLAPVAPPRKADPPVQSAQQSEQKYEQKVDNDETIEYEVVADDEPESEGTIEYDVVADDEPEDEPESDVTIFDVLAFFSVVLTGIVLISMLPVLLDNASLLNAYENFLSAFKGDIAEIGVAIIFGLVAGAIPTAIVVGITKLEINKAANLLGVCVLCFAAYGYANSGAKGVMNSTWHMEMGEGKGSFKLEIFEGHALGTFSIFDDEPLRKDFKPAKNESDIALLMGKPAFLWADDHGLDSSMFAGMGDIKFYLINEQCLLTEKFVNEEKPMDYCLVRQ